MVSITFLGGAREVGRSSILVSKDDMTILLDAGISVGAVDDDKRCPLDPPEKPKFLMVTHAHLDHCGYVPRVVRNFDIPYYATPPTQDLSELLFYDSIRILNENDMPLPYTQKDVHYLRKKSVNVRYRVNMPLNSTSSFTMVSAGHILGSSMILLKLGTHRLLYTGDFSMQHSRTLRMADLHIPHVNTVIMESTYASPADKRPSMQKIEQDFIKAIKDTYERGGKIMVAAYAVGRAQQVLLTLDAYMRSKHIPEIPIYIDGLIRDVNEKYKLYWEWLKPEIQKQIRYTQHNPFESEFFFPVKRRKDIIKSKDPIIIVSTSGMLQGGPILYYLKHFGIDENNLLVLTGYQVEGTRGRQLLEGNRDLTVGNEAITVHAEIKNFEFSGHSDFVGLFRFLASEPLKYVKNIILVHGESAKIDSFSERIASKRKDVDVYAPSVGETIKL